MSYDSISPMKDMRQKNYEKGYHLHVDQACCCLKIELHGIDGKNCV